VNLRGTHEPERALHDTYPHAYPNCVMFAPIRRCPHECPPSADLHRRTRADLGGRVSGAWHGRGHWFDPRIAHHVCAGQRRVSHI